MRNEVVHLSDHFQTPRIVALAPGMEERKSE